MGDRSFERRELLAAAGAGLVGTLAGCSAPGGDASLQGDSSARPETDGEGLADGSTYTDVYEATIDSVARVEVSGINDPLTDEEGMGEGSAFRYGDSYLITNDHVVAGGDAVDVQYIDGDWSGTRVVGTDVYSDLAVLEADHVPDAATPLSLTEDRPVVGQEVLAIGNPLGLEGSMSQGIVSGVNRAIAPPGVPFSYPNVVQTDAGLNPGNSGGPLVDLEGEVVGVVHAAGGENIGFAISSALTRRVVPALIEDGEYRHSYLGITLVSVDLAIAEENDLPEATGVIVDEVVDEPAAGVLRGSDDQVTRSGRYVPVGGDVILAIDGEPIPDRHALSTHLALETSPGDKIAIDLLRDGERITEELTLGARPLPDDPYA